MRESICKFLKRTSSIVCQQVMTFPSTCGTCTAKCETRMFVTSILCVVLPFKLWKSWLYYVPIFPFDWELTKRVVGRVFVSQLCYSKTFLNNIQTSHTSKKWLSWHPLVTLVVIAILRFVLISFFSSLSHTSLVNFFFSCAVEAWWKNSW